MDPNLKLDSAKEDVIDKEKYQCLVKKLIYMTHTRPDIAYVVSMVTQRHSFTCSSQKNTG